MLNRPRLMFVVIHGPYYFDVYAVPWPIPLQSSQYWRENGKLLLDK